MATVRSKLKGDVEENGLGKYITIRCRDLDRYMKRLAKHPVVRKDPDYRIFLQEIKTSSTLNVNRSFGESLGIKFDKFKKNFNRYSVTETDSWFKTRNEQQEELKKQMFSLEKDIRNMSREKMSLFVATSTFRRNLINLLGQSGRERAAVSHSGKGRDPSRNILTSVAEFQNTLADLYLSQAEADEMLYFLAKDYQRLLEAVDVAMSDRRKAMKILMRAQNKSSKNKGKSEEADEEIEDPINTLEEAQKIFDKVSQTLRRELGHFDTVMREEFGDTFSRYHSQYKTALSATAAIKQI